MHLMQLSQRQVQNGLPSTRHSARVGHCSTQTPQPSHAREAMKDFAKKNLPAR
jgi:hypothetical protein